MNKKKELCNVCHKTECELIILDSNILSLAKYFSMNDRWEKEGICIICQFKEKEEIK